MKALSGKEFHTTINTYERQLAKLLALILSLVVGAATIQLALQTGLEVGQWSTDWLDSSLLQLLDPLLLILIALKVRQNVTAYLQDQVIQIELVHLTALSAVARKVIVLPQGTENKPALIGGGFGIIIVGISAAY